MLRDKLHGWKATSLSLAGRKTLIQATISDIPNYYSQFTTLPKSICNKIDQANRSFHWSTTKTKKKLHLVNWDTVTKPTNRGGLGLRKARTYNITTMAKLNWRILKEPDTKWVQVIKSKYFNNGSPSEPRQGVSILSSINGKNIAQGWDLFSKAKI
ncbi:hypothetical protein LIER_36287 [Lithospermum erythrorhizon]|uniref:Uncharacterized protein n=1 Tax=Lithospermum erythrorhizon TaxID=34254 RepID=A0AAV3P508_LITER